MFVSGRYLELSDWELKEALQSAKEDREWEKEESQGNELKAGQIGVQVHFIGGKPMMNLKGIGKSTKKVFQQQIKKVSRDSGSEKPKKAESTPKVKIYSVPPPIASKSVSVEDLFNVSCFSWFTSFVAQFPPDSSLCISLIPQAAPQHNNYGFEMKDIPKRSIPLESD